jgi:hypothetical protein
MNIRSVNKERPIEWALVQDRHTGKVAACEMSHAKELQREDTKRIIATKGEKKWDELSKLKAEGKL